MNEKKKIILLDKHNEYFYPSHYNEKTPTITTNNQSMGEEEDDDDDDDENYDMFDDTETKCGCGIQLSKGWQCDKCRVNCPDCNRALTKDPEDYCTRCNEKCKKHGLYRKSAHTSCPQC